MRSRRAIDTLETHTGGMPTRIVTGGIEPLRGDGRSVAAQRDAFVEAFDDVRKLLVMEPRGHDDMFCAVLADPADPDADVGAFFMNAGGCHEDVCIHGLVGVVTALIETGRLSGADPVRIETPAGLVTARPDVDVDDGGVRSVTVENVASYVPATDVPVPEVVPGDAGRASGADEPDGHDGAPSVDVVYSGNAFALLDADDLGLDVTAANVPRLVEYAEGVLASLDGRDSLDTGAAAGVNAVAVYQSGPDRDRTLVVAPGGHVDRSPSGTGTAARMVLRHHEGDLDVGERYVAESVLGTTFEGRLRRRTRCDGRTAVVPAVTGTAHLVAKQTFLQDPEDPIVGFRGLTSRSAAFEFTASEAADR